MNKREKLNMRNGIVEKWDSCRVGLLEYIKPY